MKREYKPEKAMVKWIREKVNEHDFYIVDEFGEATYSKDRKDSFFNFLYSDSTDQYNKAIWEVNHIFLDSPKDKAWASTGGTMIGIPFSHDLDAPLSTDKTEVKKYFIRELYKSILEEFTHNEVFIKE